MTSGMSENDISRMVYEAGYCSCNSKLGMLINFNTLQFKNWVRRVINGTL